VLLGVAGGSAAVHRPNWLSTHRLRGITIFIVLITVLAWGQLMIRLVVSQLGVSNAGRAVRRDDVRDAYMVLAIRGDGNDASLCALTAKLGYAPVLQSDNDIVKVPGNLEQLMQRHLVEPRQYLSRRALLWRTEANLAWQAWRDTGEPKWRERAMDAIVGWLAHDPYGVESHLRAADIAWQAGRIDEARQWYARALELSEKAYLDELSQLTAEGRARAQLRLRSPAP
jgi:tetratricopeptide (TPR) repeat protein